MKRIRYAIVGAGWISQVAFMPAVAQTGNSVMTALVSGDNAKAAKLAVHYDIPHVIGYDAYDRLLRSGDIRAVYVALPNALHAEYSVRAANAGVHCMVEKPLAVNLEQGERMIAAARSGAPQPIGSTPRPSYATSALARRFPATLGKRLL